MNRGPVIGQHVRLNKPVTSSGLCRALPLLGALIIQGCTSVGPDYKEPTAEVASQWSDSDNDLVADQAALDPQWWNNAFKDQDLDRLVNAALGQNLSLRSAGLRVLQSQQQLAIAIGNQYPQEQQITGSAARQELQNTISNNYNVGFNLSWEIDFWGRFSRQIESASAELDSSVANYDAALLSLVSQVAQTYFQIRTFQQRIDVARQNISLQEQSLEISRRKFEAGQVSELDPDQAESIVYNTRASIFELEVSLQQLKNSLAILLGTPPQSQNRLLTQTKALPDISSTVALGIPQDIIRRRPDIRIAERQLAAQSAQIGFAVSDLYPQLSIGGSIGSTAPQRNQLFESGSKSWDIFGMFEWNVLNYGRLKSNIRLQDALFQQLLVDYQNTVLQAQGDVENSIVAYLKSHELLDAYQQAADASQRAVDISLLQYREGEITFNRVINTLLSNVQQQDLLSQAKGNVATSLVQVYKALGGGWEIRNNRDPVDLLPASLKQDMRERVDEWDGVLQ
ncbi:efflux transporter outer membrane subunit [Aestuariirhabdus sp. Z084]|uniref:efflux transporter outer membrane subunit n=1 Tax=Aestuariirhabdus haliotis TaxID=2918751 RepID=UPI00201B362B|nr:efflux transporter outer membrane subunit [Aestuariirhabdus haliotis]MCL6416142.1 efflux transporter outer membrane subunit [Aestuariirhabdus haliotis]MCL6420101.1 efflux transporter outer membrane subunit [Aestuariirhabdus haliotis]